MKPNRRTGADAKSEPRTSETMKSHRILQVQGASSSSIAMIDVFRQLVQSTRRDAFRFRNNMNCHSHLVIFYGICFFLIFMQIIRMSWIFLRHLLFHLSTSLFIGFAYALAQSIEYQQVYNPFFIAVDHLSTTILNTIQHILCIQIE